MINQLSKNQNWAKATPWMGILVSILLLWNYNPSTSMFWALINIPLYLFHQFEEHYWPGGFKDYMNHTVFDLPEGKETLTDKKIFWINILFVWVAFAIFGILAIFGNIGFGLLIIVFSLINCMTHIRQAVKSKEWNPGVTVASVQTLLSIYGAYFITTHSINNLLFWWVGSILFAVLVHVLLYKFVMNRNY